MTPEAGLGLAIIRLVRRRTELATGRNRNLLLVVATAAFVGGAVFFGLRADLELEPSRLWLLGVALVVGVPCTMALNAAEYRVGARLVGLEVKWRHALVIGVLGTAANMAPLPGAALVRVTDLRRRGASLGSASAVTAVAGLVGLFISALIAAPLLAVEAVFARWLAAALAVFSIVFLVGIKRLLTAPRWLVALTIVEILLLLVSAGRLLLVLIALGVPTTLAVSLVLAATYALSAALGFFPGGLGVREGLAAFVTATFGLGAGVGFLAASIDRVIGMLGHAPVALWLGASRRQLVDETRAIGDVS